MGAFQTVEQDAVQDAVVNSAISKFIQDKASSNKRTDIYIEAAGGNYGLLFYQHALTADPHEVSTALPYVGEARSTVTGHFAFPPY